MIQNTGKDGVIFWANIVRSKSTDKYKINDTKIKQIIIVSYETKRFLDRKGHTQKALGQRR